MRYIPTFKAGLRVLYERSGAKGSLERENKYHEIQKVVYDIFSYPIVNVGGLEKTDVAFYKTLMLFSQSITRSLWDCKCTKKNLLKIKKEFHIALMKNLTNV